jgi:hypothetical protein
MRIFSTDQSVASSEPTVLALVETLAAVAISVGIAVRYETLAHVAVSCFIAPLLLMRSSESVTLGIRWFNKLRPTKPERAGNPFLPGWQYLKTLVLSIAIKFAATARHPIKGIQCIPTNWVRVVLCTDLGTSVELVPGIGPAYDTLKGCVTDDDPYEFGALLAGVIFAAAVVFAIHYWVRPWSENILWQAFFWFLEFSFSLSWSILALGLACYVVAYFYRLSLKSTALIWLPLVYVVYTTFDRSVALSVQLEEMRESALWKLTRLLAWVTLALLISKITVLPTSIEWWNSQSWAKVLNVYVMPNEIHPWHIATGLNAAITLLGFFYFLDRAPRRIREGIWSESTVLRAVQVFTLTRGLISIYTILVGLYLTVIAARAMNWPLWSGKLVPW